MGGLRGTSLLGHRCVLGWLCESSPRDGGQRDQPWLWARPRIPLKPPSPGQPGRACHHPRKPQLRPQPGGSRCREVKPSTEQSKAALTEPRPLQSCPGPCLWASEGSAPAVPVLINPHIKAEAAEHPWEAVGIPQQRGRWGGSGAGGLRAGCSGQSSVPWGRWGALTLWLVPAEPRGSCQGLHREAVGCPWPRT